MKQLTKTQQNSLFKLIKHWDDPSRYSGRNPPYFNGRGFVSVEFDDLERAEIEIIHKVESGCSL